MAALKRNRGTWVLILLLATGFFLLRDRRGSAITNTDLTISTARTFASLDGSIDDDDGIINGVFTKNANLTIAAGGSITCDESGTPASACPITLVVTKNLEIQAGGSIHADNLGGNGGNGGNISITVGGDFTMDGPSVADPGASISSRNQGGGNGHGGDILILVGGVTVIPDPVVNPDPNNPSPAIGVCGPSVVFGVPIAENTGDALIALGATITSDSVSGRAGDIALYTGHNITVHGTVRAEGFSGAGHGGAITLDACCTLLIGDTGLVRSAGRDPGPDRVHVEACTVIIWGVVESTGPAHEAPAPLCTPPERPGKPANSTACVEIWSGTTLTIDSTDGHFGQVNADTGMSGGTSGLGWIDLLANGDITINDGVNNDHVQPIGGSPAVPVLHAVHANQYLSSGHGGIIVVQSKFGSVSTFGNAIQANDTTGGGDGGHVTVQAGGLGSPAGDVLFDSASIQAKGGVGSGSTGGTIAGRSFHGDLSGTGGELNASPAATGSVTLEACLFATYSGLSTPLFVLGPADGDCTGILVFPSPAETLLPAATCSTACQLVTPTPTDTPTNTQTPTNTNTQTPTNTNTPTPTPTPRICTEDPTAHLTKTVDPSQPQAGINYQTVQAAYNAAVNGDVIGMFGNTVENVTLGGAKTLKITQCTSARITAATANPVWNITSTGRLTIVGPDSFGGTIGWWLQTPNHTLKSVRANGASQYGILIASNGNSVSWNNVSGNGPGAGIRVTGSSNTLKGGTVGPNNGDGVQLVGSTNTLSGATADSNTANGVLVLGGSNQIKSNRASLNTADGFNNGAGTGNNYSGNSSNTGGKENGGAEYRFVTAGVNGGSNRADGVNVPSAGKCPTFPAAGTVCE